MAAIDELIVQIEDPTLRERLRGEIERMGKNRRFGLVFENHLPELTPIHSATVTRGCLVGRRDRPLDDIWRVLAVAGDTARCMHRRSNEPCALPLDELVVVRQFGEPIFPALVPVDQIENGPADAPWHTLIEADNYHALQLLEYLYAGQVDCIYIDPPYNTGARDWKYNNDYVDDNDRWRHSKWLAMMQRRLVLARRLLKPDTGVLIVTIDEHEIHHLGCLLEQQFPECHRQTVTIVINQKGVAQGRLSRAEEYAIFCFRPGVSIPPHHDDLLSPDRADSASPPEPRWERLLRGGTNSRREDRPGLFFPIFIDPERRAIAGIGDPLPLSESPDLSGIDDGTVAWPLRTDGSLGNWRVSPPMLRTLVADGYVKLGGFDRQRRTWTILYLGQKARGQIDSGVIRIIGRDPVTNAVEVEYAESQQRSIKTVWHRSTHDAGNYGATLLRTILGEGGRFSFPKSLYAVLDAIATVTRDQPEALLLDFFAGSGTTLHAVKLLNAVDGGRRQCILVTNNELSEADARSLTAQGHRPGDAEWEARGICRSVTWPRAKYTLLGRRDDGTELGGEYFTGRSVTREKPRRFVQIDFVDPASLDTPARRKRLAALIDGIPQSAIRADADFVVADTTTLFFDRGQADLLDADPADGWIEALEAAERIATVYIVSPRKARFDTLKARINERLDPVTVTEDEKRPMRDGFAANLAYFKLDFLDKNPVALGRRFREILPILWLRAGALGPRPILPDTTPEPAMLLPEGNRFAVLLDESRFARFQECLAERNDLSHVFLVTDSEDAFQEMALQIDGPQVIQLYRDYLENFMINRGNTA